MSNMETDKSRPSMEQTGNTPSVIGDCKNPKCSRPGGPHCTCRIRELNDRLRMEGQGGMVVMTNGIAALGLPTVNAIFKAIAGFSAFFGDNDPHGEHDCAVMEAEGHPIIWKIDYYDRSRTYHSPDAANPKLTVRVLTVMLAEEY